MENFKRSAWTPSTATTFNDEERKDDVPGVVQVFYDREGGLYPTANVRVWTNCMIRAFNSIEGYPAKELENTVRGYFIRQSRLDPKTVEQLEKDAGVSATGATMLDDATWQRIQTGYRESIARRISDAASGGKRVIFLVHGYRNDYGQAKYWYDHIVRPKLREQGLAKDAVFVDVFWDGTNGWRFLHVWPKAQWNMADVGLELRRLINALPDSTPITFFTHSTGTPLVANTLGDASAPFREYKERRPNDPYFKRAEGLAGEPSDKKTYAIKRRNGVRFGAVAPAAATNTFEHYTFPRDVAPERISLALNEKDFPTSKAIMPCTFKGASCMAVDLPGACQAVTNAFGPQGTQIGIFDFGKGDPPTPPSFRFWRTHAVSAYAENGRWQAFVAHLFGEDPLPASDTAALCTSEASTVAVTP